MNKQGATALLKGIANQGPEAEKSLANYDAAIVVDNELLAWLDANDRVAATHVRELHKTVRASLQARVDMCRYLRSRGL